MTDRKQRRPACDKFLEREEAHGAQFDLAADRTDLARDKQARRADVKDLRNDIRDRNQDRRDLNHDVKDRRANRRDLQRDELAKQRGEK